METPLLLRKKIVEENPQLTNRLDTELQIVMDLIEATMNGGDCLDPAVIEFQNSCHVMIKNNYHFMYLEQLQADKRKSVTPAVSPEPFYF